jgi:mannose-1-phosphate guanylyltransferase
MLHAAIMAGGGGTRFWPRSRQRRPKQFLTLAGDRSLLQMALDRIEASGIPAAQTWVITAEAYRGETREQLPDVPAGHVVGEPFGRDTAACIGLGAALVARQDSDATLLVTPADHDIEPAREFQRAVHVAVATVQENPGALVTFGIPPSFPSTNYGYIHRGELLGQRQGIPVYRVAGTAPGESGFREKPAVELAEQFFSTGEYYWNSGIFVWKAATVLAALKRQKPNLHDGVQRIADAWNSPRREEVLKAEYERLEKISIDYAVMEHAREVLVVQAPYKWDDVGSWLALERLNAQDAQDNTVLGTHCGLKTSNCVIVGEEGKLITTIGVSDLLIIQDGDSLLVADRRDESTVKQLVEELKKRKLDKYL